MSNSFVTPWTIAHQAPPSRGFSKQESWIRGIFLTQGLNPSLVSPALAGRFFITRATWEAPSHRILVLWGLRIKKGLESTNTFTVSSVVIVFCNDLLHLRWILSVNIFLKITQLSSWSFMPCLNYNFVGVLPAFLSSLVGDFSNLLICILLF